MRCLPTDPYHLLRRFLKRTISLLDTWKVVRKLEGCQTTIKDSVVLSIRLCLCMYLLLLLLSCTIGEVRFGLRPTDLVHSC